MIWPSSMKPEKSGDFHLFVMFDLAWRQNGFQCTSCTVSLKRATTTQLLTTQGQQQQQEENKQKSRRKAKQNDGNLFSCDSSLVSLSCFKCMGREWEPRPSSEVVHEMPVATDRKNCHTVIGWTPHWTSSWEPTVPSSPDAIAQPAAIHLDLRH